MTSHDAEALIERLNHRASTMNGSLVGSSDGCTYTLGYYDQFAAADDREAASQLSALSDELEKVKADIETFWKPQFNEQVERAERAEAALSSLRALRTISIEDQAEPVAWCRPEVLDKLRDGRAAKHVDLSKLRGGNYTEPLYAAPPAPASVPVVKGMEWTVERHHGFNIHVGRGLGLKYEAAIKAYSPGWIVTLGKTEVVFDSADAIEDDAKAAAQADYERRIRSSLVGGEQ